MIIVLWIIIGGICAFVCSNMANSRGRSGGLWAVLGFFFGLLAILILAVIGNANNQQPMTVGIPFRETSNLDEIAKLKKLLDDGVLTAAEFEQQKSRLLARS